MNISSLTTTGAISTSEGSISSQYGMYNYNQPLYNGSSLAQVGTSLFTGNARFDGAVDVFGTFSSNGNANFSGTTTQFITQPTFLTALSIPLVGTGNATRVPTVSSLTLGNQSGHQGVIKVEDGTAGAPYGANYIQNINYTLRFTGSDPTVNSVAFDMPVKFNSHMTVKEQLLLQRLNLKAMVKYQIGFLLEAEHLHYL